MNQSVWSGIWFVGTPAVFILLKVSILLMKINQRTHHTLQWALIVVPVMAEAEGEQKNKMRSVIWS